MDTLHAAEQNLANDLLTSSEAGLILQRAPDTVRSLARRGQLKAAVVTRAGRLFLRSDVEALARRLRRN